MLPQGKSSRVQVQNRCLEKETKKEKMSMKRFYHYLTMTFNNCPRLALTFHSLPSKNSHFQPLGSQYNIYFTTTNLPHIPAEMQRLLRHYKKKHRIAVPEIQTWQGNARVSPHGLRVKPCSSIPSWRHFPSTKRWLLFQYLWSAQVAALMFILPCIWY